MKTTQILAMVLTLSSLGHLPTRADIIDRFGPTNGFKLPMRPDVTERFGGGDKARLVASPRLVTAWRTVGSLTSSSSIDHMNNRWNREGGGVLVSSNLVGQLSKILLNEDSYLSPDVRDNCIHEPDFVLTFSDGSRNLDIFFCLDCWVMEVRSKGEKDPPYSLFANGVPHNLLNIIKQTFPKDNAVQALQSNH